MERLEKCCVVAFLIFAVSGTVFFIRNTIAPMVSFQLSLPPSEPPAKDSSSVYYFDRGMSQAELEEAAGFLSSFSPSGVPEGWQVAVVTRERGPFLPEGPRYLQVTLLLKDGTFRTVEPGGRMVDIHTPPEDKDQLDGDVLGAMLDVGDCLAINPRAWGRTYEDLDWVFKDGEFRLLKKFAVAVSPAISQ